MFGKESEEVTEEEPPSKFARFYDERAISWTDDAEQNLMYLACQENYSNDRLKHRGYLFPNDVYDMLGIARTSAGQKAGWVYTKDEQDHVSFNVHSAVNRDFINGHSKIAFLDFNVRDDILSYL